MQPEPDIAQPLAPSPLQRWKQRWFRSPRKQILWALIVILVYCAGYGYARWRKFIVMNDYFDKEEGVYVRATGPGWDIRQDWVGRTKNWINGPLFTFFKPLTMLEDALRGSRRRLASANEPNRSDYGQTSQPG